MGTSQSIVEDRQRYVESLKKQIANIQARLKGPNLSKNQKEAYRKDIARLKESLASAKESLKSAKENAKRYK